VADIAVRTWVRHRVPHRTDRRHPISRRPWQRRGVWRLPWRDGQECAPFRRHQGSGNRGATGWSCDRVHQ